MIGAAKHSKKKTIPTIKFITCPACEKDRFSRYADKDGNFTPASEETVKVRDKDRYLEACDFCVARYKSEDEKFIRENLRKLSKAINVDSPPEGESDHKDFSLN